MVIKGSLLAATTMLPSWVVLPLAMISMLVIASHVLAIHQSDLPLRRRRIRVVNGFLLLFVTALLAFALGMAEVAGRPAEDPAGTRQFVMVWMTIVGLLAIIVMLAAADAVNTVTHRIAQRRTLRRQMRSELAADLTTKHALQRASPPAPHTTRPTIAGRQDARRGG